MSWFTEEWFGFALILDARKQGQTLSCLSQMTFCLYNSATYTKHKKQLWLNALHIEDQAPSESMLSKTQMCEDFAEFRRVYSDSKFSEIVRTKVPLL